MDQQHQEHIVEALAQAHKTIEQQAKEIEILRQQGEREQFAQELRRLLTTATTTNMILSPMTHAKLLEMVVQTAAQVISARAGSLFLIDQEAQDLVFEVAIGPAAQAAKKFRVPLGHGIAGLVAVTGQPMAITDARQDKRLAIDIASTINYIPNSILCVPLFYEDRVIGALELLDKMGNESAFNPSDIQALGLFANIAAVAITQSQAYHDQQTVLNALLRSFHENDPEQRQQMYQQAIAFSEWMDTEDTTYARARELALLVHELVSYGERELTMCLSILQSFVTNFRSRSGVYELMMK